MFNFFDNILRIRDNRTQKKLYKISINIFQLEQIKVCQILTSA